MKKKGGRATTRTRRSSMAELLETPSPAVSPSEKSLKPDIFSDSSKHKKTVAIGSSTTALFNSPAHTPSQTVSSVSDLKDMASSRLDDLKRHIDRSHSEIFKDLDAFNTRLHKRFKIQNEACQQVSGETEKEYKKTSERIAESREAMMSSYAEFMADAQTTATYACKTSITKLSQSFEKAIDGLRSRYGTSSS